MKVQQHKDNFSRSQFSSHQQHSPHSQHSSHSTSTSPSHVAHSRHGIDTNSGNATNNISHNISHNASHNTSHNASSNTSNVVFATAPKLLGTFSLVMITVGSVDSIRNLPTIALFGSSLIFFFALAALFFLIPSSLITAELASTWPEEGGIYTWVKHAFGKPIGFLTIWLQWIGNVIWYPTILSFAAATLGYLISPELATNKLFLIAVILTSFWGVTIINLLGLRSSAMFSSVCTILGLLMPMLLICWLGFKWYFSGNATHLDFSPQAVLPKINEPAMWVALTGIIMSFCGMEVATIHAESVKNPHRAFPVALFVATAVLICTLLFGSLAVAIVLPEQKISLIVGIMQTFNAFFTSYKMLWVMPFIAAVLVLGCLGGINNWIIAPTKGLSIAARDGHLPLHFARENRHRSPHLLLIYQALIVTLLMLVFLLMPSVNASYWLLTAMAAQLYMLMYILVFSAAVYLRFKAPHCHKARPFGIPGKKKHFGMCIVAGAGILCALLTFFIGFMPPSIVEVGEMKRYELILVSGLVLMCLPPFIIYHVYAKHRINKE